MTKIAWTERTLNFLAGCTMVSLGCQNCYAMRMAARLEAMGQEKYAGVTRKSGGRAVWTGEVRLVESELAKLYQWKEPCMIFAPSMSDLFHERVPFEFVDKVMAAIADNPRHTVQILTKRADRMAEYLEDKDSTPGNVWFGVSAENDSCALQRIPFLDEAQRLGNPTFVSYEPALGPIDWRPEWSGIISQIIVGAESGANRRPFDMQWARDTRDFCLEHGIAFFMKQGSAFKSGVNPWLVEPDGSRWQWHQYPGNLALPVEVVT